MKVKMNINLHFVVYVSTVRTLNIRVKRRVAYCNPVSYTHLDVYKRQVLHITKLPIWYFTSLLKSWVTYHPSPVTLAAPA